MEIVIDIPEKTYRRIQALDSNNYFEHDICGFAMRRIANGTPLPKGHGRLIDGDELERRMKIGYKIVRDVPTIIEADKEQKE